MTIFLMVNSLAFSQNSASATFTASVNIVEPLEIKTTSHMNFASIDARNGGQVVLSPNSTRTGFGDVDLQEGAEVSAASFEVSGQAAHTFSIEVPTGEYRLANGPHSITIKDFICETTRHQDVEGKQVIKLGATLKIEPNQLPGQYTSIQPMRITVSYN